MNNSDNVLFIQGTPGPPPGARTPSSSYGGPMSAGPPVHPPDFHHPSPQHHMGMGHMHSSPTKMHQGPHPTHQHHPGAGGGPFSWQHGSDMQMGGGRDGHYPMDSSGMPHHYQQQQQHSQQPPHQQQQQHKDDEVMSTDSSSSSSTDSN